MPTSLILIFLTVLYYYQQYQQNKQMSIASHNTNNGPLNNNDHTNSKQSLYSNNSYNSNEDSPPNKQSMIKPQQLISSQIKNQQSRYTTHNLTNNNIKGVEYHHDKSGQKQFQNVDKSEPMKRSILEDQPSQNKKFFTQFNTINVASFEIPNIQGSRYHQRQELQPIKPGGASRVTTKLDHRASFYAQKQRMLRSSQGGRWFRSQSLMKSKDKTGNSNGVQLGNYYPNGSKFADTVERYLKHYYTIQQYFHTRWSRYKLSLGDSLQEIKNKMEIFLQKKINLSHIPIDRPDSDWKQDQLAEFYSNYEPILVCKPENNSSQDKGKTPIILKKYKNCVYYGPILNGKKHGFGYLHYFSGRFYEGLFEEDQKTEGFEMDDSELYLGHYKKNQRHGEGILKTNECMLAGYFTNGEFSASNLSEQKEDSPSHYSYDGFKIQFSCIRVFAKSQLIIDKNAQGDIYIGQIQGNPEIKYGLGLEIFNNGDIYVGRYQQGAPDGYGQYYWQSGAFYRGQFLSGMRHGKGVWMMINGDKYEGQYMNDKKNGKGTYIWKTGDIYEGYFENDYRHGYGQMKWRNGTVYKGNWSNGIQVNKVIKLEQEKNRKDIKLPRAVNHKNITQATKSSIQTLEAKKRVTSTKLSFSRNGRTSDSTQKNSKRVPLQKLKAMLNPTNNIN